MLTYNSNRKACKVVTALADGQKHHISILEGLSATEFYQELISAGFIFDRDIEDINYIKLNLKK